VKSHAETLNVDSLILRAMTTQDLTQIVAIECNAHVSPWARLSFEESLTKEYVCRVIENGGDVIAYSVLCPVADELHILNIAAALQCQGVGLGHMLIQDVIDIAQQHFMRNGNFKKYQFVSDITAFRKVKIPMSARTRLFIFCNYNRHFVEAFLDFKS